MKLDEKFLDEHKKYISTICFVEQKRILILLYLD